MTASNADGGTDPAPAPAVKASGPTSSPWLKILGVSASASAIVLLVGAAAAWLLTGGNAALSAVLGGGLVIVFFGLSLLVGHFVGRSNPSGAIGMFVVTYVVKVVGFAVVLFALGRPQWLDGTWFFAAAVATVLVWQIAEIAAFSKTRYLLYGDADTQTGGA
ncbi:hypothetical protein [Arthrobacter monumenti]